MQVPPGNFTRPEMADTGELRSGRTPGGPEQEADTHPMETLEKDKGGDDRKTFELNLNAVIRDVKECEDPAAVFYKLEDGNQLPRDQ